MKGHSERVPNKNIRKFYDEPLFFKILHTLHDSAYIETIIINTDSDQIAQMATDNFKKVKINVRPENIRGDFVSTNKLIKYDLTTTNAQNFIQTHATNPLLTTKTVNKAIELFFDNLNKGFDSIFSVTKIQNRFYDHIGRPINHNPSELIRTQDLNPLLEENSNFYIFSRESFLEKENRIGTKPFLYQMDKLEAIDIDNEEDFILAECLYQYKRQNK